MICMGGNYFSHDKKDSLILFVYASVSIILVNLTYFIVKYTDISLDNSFFTMFTAQIITLCIAYIVTLKNFPEFNFSIRLPAITHKFGVLFALIILPQVLIFIYVEINSGITKLPFSFILIAILVIIVPFYEEVFYRGCLFGFLCSLCKGNVIYPSLITSVVFCSMHAQSYDLMRQLTLFFSSLIFVYARVLTRGLFYPFVLHSIMNAAFLILNMHI